jgi:dCTP deaminase
MPILEKLMDDGSASVDLRLGTWFVNPRCPRIPYLDIHTKDETGGDRPPPLTETHYVRFGQSYYLHPNRFVLGITLEWLRIPKNLGAYVIGKSSLGRRGLVIATATGVHPGFTGCLTLELTNLGEVPIAIKPGMLVCQLFFHSASDLGSSNTADQSQFNGTARPKLGKYELDPVAAALARAAQ